MKILFIGPYPKDTGPSQRFRFEHYLPYLKDYGIAYDYFTFLTGKDHKILTSSGNIPGKVSIMLWGLLRSIFLMFTMYKYSLVYIHRQIVPFGPPVLEWFLARVLRKRFIYDFDDAIWIDQSSKVNPMAAKFKAAWKTKYLCQWAWKVSVGNKFLARYAINYNANTFIVPTVINTSKYQTLHKNTRGDIPTLGWTGTFTNFPNLHLVLDALIRLQKEIPFDFIFIADKDPEIPALNYTYIPWNTATELEDLSKIDVGIMPLINEEWQLGKCAFKAIQYMGVSSPAVVSPVGANCEVVLNGINGFWADSAQDWYDKLKLLITNDKLREEFGNKGREHIESNYSVKSTLPVFISLLTEPVNID